MVPCLMTSIDLQKRRAGLSPSAQLWFLLMLSPEINVLFDASYIKYVFSCSFAYNKSTCMLRILQLRNVRY